MLNTTSVTEYLATVRAFADKTGQREQLEDQLDRLGRLFDHDLTGRSSVRLFKDFAPYSFEFCVQRPNAAGELQTIVNGGLIFHGRHDNGGDGGSPTYSVSLSPSDGWSIHT